MCEVANINPNFYLRLFFWSQAFTSLKFCMEHLSATWMKSPHSPANLVQHVLDQLDLVTHLISTEPSPNMFLDPRFFINNNKKIRRLIRSSHQSHPPQQKKTLLPIFPPILPPFVSPIHPVIPISPQPWLHPRWRKQVALVHPTPAQRPPTPRVEKREMTPGISYIKFERQSEKKNNNDIWT